MEKLANQFALFCLPAQLFLIFMFVDLCYIFFVKLQSHPKIKLWSMKLTIMMFLLFCLAGLGWSFIVNYACGYEKNVAIGLAAIPLLYFTFK